MKRILKKLKAYLLYLDFLEKERVKAMIDSGRGFF